MPCAMARGLFSCLELAVLAGFISVGMRLDRLEPVCDPQRIDPDNAIPADRLALSSDRARTGNMVRIEREHSTTADALPEHDRIAHQAVPFISGWPSHRASCSFNIVMTSSR